MPPPLDALPGVKTISVANPRLAGAVVANVVPPAPLSLRIPGPNDLALDKNGPPSPIRPPPPSTPPPEHAFRSFAAPRRPISIDKVPLPPGPPPSQAGTTIDQPRRSMAKSTTANDCLDLETSDIASSSSSSSESNDDNINDDDAFDSEANLHMWNVGLSPVDLRSPRSKALSVPYRDPQPGFAVDERRRASELIDKAKYAGPTFDPSAHVSSEQPETDPSTQQHGPNERCADQRRSSELQDLSDHELVNFRKRAMSLPWDMQKAILASIGKEETARGMNGEGIVEEENQEQEKEQVEDQEQSTEQAHYASTVLDDLDELQFVRPPDHAPPDVRVPSPKKSFFAYEYPDSVLESSLMNKRDATASHFEMPFSPKLKNKPQISHPAASHVNNDSTIVSTLDYKRTSPLVPPNTMATPLAMKDTISSSSSPHAVDDAYYRQISTLEASPENETDAMARILEVLEEGWRSSFGTETRVLVPQRLHETIYLLDPLREGVISGGQVSQLLSESLGLQLDLSKVLSLCQVLESSSRSSLKRLSPRSFQANEHRFPYRLLIKAVDEFSLRLQQRRQRISSKAVATKSFALAQIIGAKTSMHSPSSTRARAVALDFRLAQYARWVNGLGIWRSKVDVPELVAGCRNGMLLCALIAHLLEQRAHVRQSTSGTRARSGTHASATSSLTSSGLSAATASPALVSIARDSPLFGANWKIKGNARTPCIKNIELALGVLWRQPGARVRNIPTAEQIFQGDREGLLQLLQETVTSLVLGGPPATSSRLRTVLAWTDRALGVTGRRLPSAVLRSPHHGLWALFQKADLILCLLYRYFPTKIRLECVYYNPTAPAEVRSNCDELMSYLKHLGIATGLTAQDLCSRGEEQLDMLLLLLFTIYHRLRELKLNVTAVEPKYKERATKNVAVEHSGNRANLVGEARQIVDRWDQQDEDLASARLEASSATPTTLASKPEDRVMGEESVPLSVDEEYEQEAIALAVVRCERQLMAREMRRTLARARAKQSQRLESRWDLRAAASAAHANTDKAVSKSITSAPLASSLALQRDKVVKARLFFKNLPVAMILPAPANTKMARTVSLIGTQMRFAATDLQGNQRSGGYFLLSDVDNVILERYPSAPAAATKNASPKRAAGHQPNNRPAPDADEHLVTLVFRPSQIERVSFCSNGILSTYVQIKCQNPTAFYHHLHSLLVDNL